MFSYAHQEFFTAVEMLDYFMGNNLALGGLKDDEMPEESATEITEATWNGISEFFQEQGITKVELYKAAKRFIAKRAGDLEAWHVADVTDHFAETANGG